LNIAGKPSSMNTPVGILGDASVTFLWLSSLKCFFTLHFL